jgi:hypothetical protein
VGEPPACRDDAFEEEFVASLAPDSLHLILLPTEQAASARAASIVSAYTASQIVSIVTVLAADQPVAVAVALAVVSDALRRPAASPTR